MRLAVALFVVVVVGMFSALIQQVFAQEENTTTTTPTVTLPPAPNITVIYTGEASVNAVYEQGRVVCYYTCYYSGSYRNCPNATYIIMDLNGTVYYNASYMVVEDDCRGTVNICRYRLEIPVNTTAETLKLVYILWWGSEKRNYTLILTAREWSGPWAYIAQVLPLGVAAGLGAQYGLAGSGIGAILGVIVLYLLSIAGVTQFNPWIANIAIVYALIALYFSKK